MQEALYIKIFKSVKFLSSSSIKNIKSYSNNTIQIIGEKEVEVRFSREGPVVKLVIIVIKNIPGTVTPFLFGSDSMKRCMASVGYIGDPNNPTPQLKIDIPLITGVTTYHASPSETLKCVGIYDLYPHQYKQCVFMMHPAAPLLRVDTVIINPLTTGKTFKYSHQKQVWNLILN
jgi:hypothetical protein